MSKQRSNQDGVLKDETTELPQDMQSINAENPSISDTSGTTAPLSPSFQPTENSKQETENPNASYAQLGIAFLGKLGKLVEWHKIKLGDGREGYALFFPLAKWKIDPVSKEILPR